MEGIFLEFENENSLRSYPFAAGCAPVQNAESEIPAGVFIDAALYPVNPKGTLYLSSISEEGVFNVSDSSGVVMSGSATGSVVELFDMSQFARHVGTLVASSAEALSDFAGRGVAREYTRSETEFSASCVTPVVVDGVVSISVGGSSPASGRIGFSNGDEDDIRVSSRILDDGRKTLRFDVIPKFKANYGASIKRIICVVDGETPFRIARSQEMYNSVILKLAGIDRDTVCSSVHREDSMEMSDTCGCEDESCKHDIPGKEDIPHEYQMVEVFIPPDEERYEGGVEEGADNAFYLIVPNSLGEVNPLSITLEDGVSLPRTTDPDVIVKGDSVEFAGGVMMDDVSSKGVVIQVPGLSGGMQ